MFTKFADQLLAFLDNLLYLYCCSYVAPGIKCAGGHEFMKN